MTEVLVRTGYALQRAQDDRIRATLSEPETDDTIHRYGAWFLAPSKSSRVSTAKSLGLSLQSPEAHGKPDGGRR
jgi:hypothetical protein